MFHNYPSLIKIKKIANSQAKFSFKPVNLYPVREVIKRLPSNTATAGGLIIKILKESRFTFEYLTCCVMKLCNTGISRIP